VEDLLQEPFSSRLMHCVAGAVGTNRRLFELTHDKHRSVLTGCTIVHLNLSFVATCFERPGHGVRRLESPENRAWYPEETHAEFTITGVEIEFTVRSLEGRGVKISYGFRLGSPRSLSFPAAETVLDLPRDRRSFQLLPRLWDFYISVEVHNRGRHFANALSYAAYLLQFRVGSWTRIFFIPPKRVT
jgi:hypothetical protein